jgi:iron complex outermembrane receptor protein
LIANSVALPKAQDPLGLTRAQYDTDPRSVDPSALLFNTRKTVDQSQAGLIYERKLDAANSIRALVYSGHRNTLQYQSIPVATQGNPLHPGGVIALGSDYAGTDLRWTLRSSIAERPLTVVAGVAADSLDQQRQGFLSFTGTGPTQVLGVQGAPRRNENDKANNLDEYMQATWQVATDWSVSAGLRHSHVQIESIDHYIVGTNGDDSGATRFSATLPVVGVMYAVSPSVHLYMTAGRGFETPTLNELAYRPDGSPGMNFALQPAHSDNVEVGVKTRLASIGDFTAALFNTRTTNEIVTLTNTGGRSTYQNAGSTRRTGVELGWSNYFSEAVHAQAAFNVIDATYRDSFLTCNITPCPASAQQTIPSGNRIPGIAKSSLYAALGWEPPLGWRANVEGRYVSKVYVNDGNTDAAPAYVIASANLGYVAKVGPWKLTGFVRGDNLFDRRYAGSVIVNEGNSRFFEPAPGRTWLAGVSSTLTF